MFVYVDAGCVGVSVGVVVGAPFETTGLAIESVTVGAGALLGVVCVFVFPVLGTISRKSRKRKSRKRNAKLPVAILAFVLHALNPVASGLYTGIYGSGRFVYGGGGGAITVGGIVASCQF